MSKGFLLNLLGLSKFYTFKKECEIYTSNINKKNDIKNNIRTLYSSTFVHIKYLIKLGIIDKKLNDKRAPLKWNKKLIYYILNIWG